MTLTVWLRSFRQPLRPPATRSHASYRSARRQRARFRPHFDQLESRLLLSLDAGFGSGGLAYTDFPPSRNDYGWDAALQADGKLVVVGMSENTSAGGFNAALARFLPDGSLDASFGSGSGGRVLSDFGGFVQSANAVVLQADGKIVVAGSATPGGGSTGRDAALARFLPDGSLDTTFGSGGIVTTNTGFSVVGGTPDDDEFFDVALQPDGKIVAAGISVATTTYGLTSNFLVVRYTSEGSLDASFGALDPSSDLPGVVTTNFGGDVPVGFDQFDVARAVAIGAGGQITVAGGTVRVSDPTVGGVAIARYAPDGNYDSTERITLEVGSPGFDEAKSVQLLGDGGFVVAGAASTASGLPDMFLARFLPSGTPDPSFGTGGVTVTSFGSTGDLITSLAVQPDGKLVAAGVVGFAGFASGTPGIDPLGGRFYSTGNVMLLRYTTGGSLDTSFDSDGWFAPTPGLPGAHLNNVSLQGDGKIVAAGFQPHPVGFDFLALRFEEPAVPGENHPPVAVADAAATNDRTAVTISVLANDFDVDGDSLSIVGVTAPAHGSISVSSSVLIYTPTINFGGTDTFTYTIADGHGGFATAAVTVTVADVTPPQVVDVSVRGSRWTGPAYHIPVGSGAQLRPLPWVNINQVRIRFNENVAVSRGDLVLHGVRIHSYGIGAFSYDPTTFTATWTLAGSTLHAARSSPLLNDKLLLDLSDAVHDAGGNLLDGEWDNPASVSDPSSDTYASGNSVAGGRFGFRFNVLGGDVNQSGGISVADVLTVAALIRAKKYDPRADVDGDGVVDAHDLIWIARRLGETLPPGEPLAP